MCFDDVLIELHQPEPTLPGRTRRVSCARNIGPQQLIDFSRIADGLRTKVPAGRRGERYRDFGDTNPGQFVSVTIDLRHQEVTRGEFVVDHLSGAFDGARITDTGNLRELQRGHWNQGLVAQVRIATIRRPHP